MVNDIGIDANPPKEKCDDPYCPWHGHIKIRGRVFVGKVVSTRMSKSAVVEWSYIKKSKKYRRYMRSKTRITVHVPPCILVKPGDVVKIGETRPISKTKSFVIIEKLGE
ncbi:MAG: 30S ribosomal protein S17 [Candidatus Nanohaloarchaeota archaeon]|nr:30S ribosomal protein S17 [Candidatus Nanohaloarchaeota archaeon]